MERNEMELKTEAAAERETEQLQHRSEVNHCPLPLMPELYLSQGMLEAKHGNANL